MSSAIIVTARAFPAAIQEPLSTLGEVRVFDTGAPEESLKGATVWLGTAVDPVSRELIASFPDSLGLIANLGVGTDNVDLVAAKERGILVSNTPVVTEDTADLTFALLLATCRRVGECERALRGGDWAGGAALMGRRVHGAKLGIIGFGAIGQAVAQRARGFDMDVGYHGPRRKADAEASTGARWYESLDQLLEESDIVSLNCPLTQATRHIMNETSLGLMKPEAILINTGRGPLVDEGALVAALQAGRLAGAGLDVFEFEPSVTPALLELPNVTLLPHIGSATGACRKEMVGRAFANVQAFLQSGKALDLCTPR
ncbi:2-hydroxyacid dehydrogenase [Congregibacter litoralis]|uniref:Lactate dehydrogenase n=1 Tax=Congregibacter litoralis KT71 TaxID=314285 RepID=A4A9T4_9GAMM|nr:D-glycerate dehydrogenase [Congregibacter litoralis]EAQ97251.2 Lactate dehydrogenase [Congregibacter litoralis KT71]